MAKTRNAARRRSAAPPPSSAKKPKKKADKPVSFFASRSTRETIESIVLAVLLAFVFRAFEAEAFVIPTGSMAPTLMGRHLEIACPQCGYRHRVGASSENNDGRRPFSQVRDVTCPICRFGRELDRNEPGGEIDDVKADLLEGKTVSYHGDRIIVSKLAYEIGKPERWDVFVFKFPGNTKENYIKRLVGLENETLRIRHGDIFIRDDLAGDDRFRIARKSPGKLTAMLQLVDDTSYIGQKLATAINANKWKSSWQSWGQKKPAWSVVTSAGGQQFSIDGKSSETEWLGYRHLKPTSVDWGKIEDGEDEGLSSAGFKGRLIADHYAYNTGDEDEQKGGRGFGMHWVGDLAVESLVEVKGEKGELLIELIEGGVGYRCSIDTATGKATLSFKGGEGEFADGEKKSKSPTADTIVHAGGSYLLRFANVDDELTLWVNDVPIAFDGPTRYKPVKNVRPVWSETDPGDAEPIRIGSRGAELSISRLRVLRDVYYIAVKHAEYESSLSKTFDYDRVPDGEAFAEYSPLRYNDEESNSKIIQDVQAILARRIGWTTSPLFDDDNRRSVEFTMKADQFFALGDNSQASQDSRLWSPQGENGFVTHYIGHTVPRRLLIGKAMFIYWPHGWNKPVPFTPNWPRYKFIR